MNELRNYHCRETLKNAAEVTIRSVRPDDQERIEVAFRKLERETVYSRFFGYRDSLSAAELSRMVATDFVDDVMLLVTIDAAESEILIGSGSYSTCSTPDDGPSAEVAFIVEEDFQGIGIASRLLTHLTRIARDQGITQFDAEVLAGNRPMLNVFAHSGLPMRRRSEGDVVQVSLLLTIGRAVQAQASAPEVYLGRSANIFQSSIKPYVVARDP